MTAVEANDFLQNKTPLEKFAEWLKEAQSTSLKQPDAFTLCTLTADSKPRSRIVLVKEIRDVGIVFFTNYKSMKGRDLERTPYASANFYWDTLFRQVNFQGEVSRLSRAESEAYWATRPRLSQLAQWVSQQSEPVDSRKKMEEELAAADQKFLGTSVPCPIHWGGYLLSPTKVEFWQGREGRFHDRYSYQKVENQWRGQRLYP